MVHNLTLTFLVSCKNISTLQCEYAPSSLKMRACFTGQAWYYGANEYGGDIVGREIFVSLNGRQAPSKEDSEWFAKQGAPNGFGLLTTVGKSGPLKTEQPQADSPPSNTLDLFLTLDGFNAIYEVLDTECDSDHLADLQVVLSGKSLEDAVSDSSRSLLSILHPRLLDLSLPRTFVVVGVSATRKLASEPTLAS